MTLSEAIEKYSGNSYILQTRGNGSTDPIIVDYFEALSTDGHIEATELAPMDQACVDAQDMLDLYCLMAKLDRDFELVSAWTKPFIDSDFCYRIIF